MLARFVAVRPAIVRVTLWSRLWRAISGKAREKATPGKAAADTFLLGCPAGGRDGGQRWSSAASSLQRNRTDGGRNQA